MSTRSQGDKGKLTERVFMRNLFVSTALSALMFGGNLEATEETSGAVNPEITASVVEPAQASEMPPPNASEPATVQEETTPTHPEEAGEASQDKKHTAKRKRAKSGQNGKKRGGKRHHQNKKQHQESSIIPAEPEGTTPTETSEVVQ
jgi:hypothetical protein